MEIRDDRESMKTRDGRDNNGCIYFAGVDRHPLKQVFDMYIEEEISDEQIQRVLKPVLKLISEGAFNRPCFPFNMLMQKRPMPRIS